MLRSVVQRFLCRRYAPLLAPYNEGGEGGLNAAARARVAAHLEDCPNCRAEFAELEAVSALLRAHVPTPAAPAADFWSKLETRIQAEAPRPQLAPDAPLLPSPEPRFVWNVFGRSFASAGAVVGVAVACALVVLQKGLEVFPLSNPTPTATAAATPPATETVTIALIPKETGSGNGRATGGGRLQGTPPPEIFLRRDASDSLRVASAESRIPNPESRPKSALSVRVAETSPVAQTSRPIRLEIRRGKAFNGTPPRYADNSAKRRDVVALGYIEPREPQDAPLATAFDSTDNLTENTDAMYAMRPAEAMEETHIATARVPLRQVAWVPDAELEARAVPASASAADSLMQERQRQTLFSYTR